MGSRSSAAASWTPPARSPTIPRRWVPSWRRCLSWSWIREAAVLKRIENYLHSGMAFAYLQAELPAAGG